MRFFTRYLIHIRSLHYSNIGRMVSQSRCLVEEFLFYILRPKFLKSTDSTRKQKTSCKSWNKLCRLRPILFDSFFASPLSWGFALQTLQTLISSFVQQKDGFTIWAIHIRCLAFHHSPIPKSHGSYKPNRQDFTQEMEGLSHRGLRLGDHLVFSPLLVDVHRNVM